MPKYDFACDECGATFELERPMTEASNPAPCPVCSKPGRRVYSMPRLLFKADPKDVRPVWHEHDGYAHAHAPRRGRHRLPSEDH
jgi:putative FmdB family regulatory protein